MLLTHHRHRGADAVDRAEDVDAVAAVPVLGGQVVDAAVGCEHAGVADEHVETTEALDGVRDDRFHLVDLAHVGEHRFDRRVARASCAIVAASAASLTSLNTRSVSASPARRALIALAERPTRAGDRNDPSLAHTSKYPPSTVSTVPVTKAAASDARNWYAPTRSRGWPHRCCAVCPTISSDSCGSSIQPSARGESNQPGATTLTVIPVRAQVEREPLGEADEPGLRCAVRGEPLARPLAEH